MSYVKIVKKSTCWWKHGKHNGLNEVSLIENKQKNKRKEIKKIDISTSDWSSKKKKS